MGEEMTTRRSLTVIDGMMLCGSSGACTVPSEGFPLDYGREGDGMLRSLLLKTYSTPKHGSFALLLSQLLNILDSILIVRILRVF